jgi:RecA/RadA recombinase
MLLWLVMVLPLVTLLLLLIRVLSFLTHWLVDLSLVGSHLTKSPHWLGKQALEKHFLNANPDGGVIYFESESAISRDMIESRGIDSKRMVIFPVGTIEEFRTQAVRILDKYLKEPKDERQPLMFVLDSLGMLSTTKEMEDVANDKQVRDMTKSQLIKGAFRVLTLKLGQANVPMIVTNHTYDVIGSYVPQKEMGGGTGLKYAASTIIYLSKSKEKDGTEVVGNIIKCEAKKSRLTKEGSKIATRLFFDERGLDRYYGLLELGEEHGVFTRKGNRIVVGLSFCYSCRSREIFHGRSDGTIRRSSKERIWLWIINENT